jgi:hypothetical protein
MRTTRCRAAAARSAPRPTATGAGRPVSTSGSCMMELMQQSRVVWLRTAGRQAIGMLDEMIVHIRIQVVGMWTAADLV